MLSMSPNLSRRRFLGTSAAFAGPLIMPSGSLFGRKISPNEKLNIGVIGAGGKGTADSEGVMSENIVALCDVDERTLRARKGRFPKAQTFSDYRVMLEKIGDKLDAVTVSTPDHHHFPASMLAMELGLHVYVQKPLAHTVWQAREMLKLSRKKKVITQMGNQGHAYSSTRKLVEVVRSGIIGEVNEAHVWTDRPIWPQGMDRPEGSKPVPDYLDWDLWLGPAPERPYHDGYHPFKWRGFWDFGTGALGDMGCHILDPIYWALELTAPTTILCEGPQPKKETFPRTERILYRFPGTARTAGRTIEVTWHDGGNLPDPAECDLPADTKLPPNGCMFVGEQGVVVCPHGSGKLPRLYPEKTFQDLDFQVFPTIDHYGQWVEALKGGDTPTSSFDYAGPLCETVLLGCVASRLPGASLTWDTRSLRFKNNSEADGLLHQEYRKGWEVEGI